MDPLQCCTGITIVPRLYYVPESELTDDLGAAVGSMVTLRDINYQMEPMIEEIPFLWAQALYLIAKLTSMYVYVFVFVVGEEERKKERERGIDCNYL